MQPMRSSVKHEMFTLKQLRTSVRGFLAQRTSLIKRQEEVTYFKWVQRAIILLKICGKENNKRSKTSIVHRESHSESYFKILLLSLNDYLSKSENKSSMLWHHDLKKKSMYAWYFYYFFRMTSVVFSNMNKHLQCNNIQESGQSLFLGEHQNMHRSDLHFSHWNFLSQNCIQKPHLFHRNLNILFCSVCEHYVCNTMTYSLRRYETWFI